MSGSLYGVGVGPGDPELITLKAARLIGAADVIAYHQAPGKASNARAIAAGLFPAGVIEEVLEYPVTTGATDHPGGYDGAMAEFYDQCADRLAVQLDAGRTVVVLAEGDPLFYGSFMYVFDLLRPRYDTQVVPGVTSLAAATAASGTSLVHRTEAMQILPGTLAVPELAARMAGGDAAVIMKLGRRFAGVVEALRQAGRLDQAVYVERASFEQQRVLPVAQVDPASVPYFSLILLPARDLSVPIAPDQRSPTGGTVHVVGLGPGPAHWLTPEVEQVLGQVGHVVGYQPYVDRVAQRPGLVRHPSGNTVEVERARFALDLAAAGEQVAVVSGGDAGIFGMASAVFEAAEQVDGVQIVVHPGLSAVQAVAAKAGAPIGADFAVVSLSDRLKPWSVLADRLAHIAAADLVLALYNPASRTRTEQIEQARQILLAARAPQTVVVIGRDIGRPGESLTVTTLADWDTSTVDMKCLVIIGASSTRVTDQGRVWTPRFVPSD